MPDEFDDALDRMDVTFADFDGDSILATLDDILGRPASLLQFEMVNQRIQTERQNAVLAGVSVDRFRRGGGVVTGGRVGAENLRKAGHLVATQLRYTSGRFVTQGARNIRDFLGGRQ